MGSKYVLLAKLKARYDLECESYEVGELILHKFKKEKEVRKQLFIRYNYIPEKHLTLFSPHSIIRNEGCGCKYCTELHNYVRTKLNLHYFKRTFENGFDNSPLLVQKETTIPTHSNFHALYSHHSVMNSKEDTLLQIDFYNNECDTRKKEIKELRSKYKISKNAIDTLLSAS